MPINPDRVCQLCDRQWVTALGVTVEEANATGQQLFLANMPWPVIRSRTHNGHTRNLRAPSTTARPGTTLGTDHLSFRLAQHRQLVFFDLPRDLRAAHRQDALPPPRDTAMAAVLDTAVLEHGRRHGWPSSSIKRTRLGMRILQGIQDTPGTALLASDALLLKQLRISPLNVIEVGSAVGLLIDDRTAPIHRWFTEVIADLPIPMRTELGEWFDVMLNGSSQPPRRRPRHEITIRTQLRWALPALHIWAATGHHSLCSISPDDVRDVLPAAGNPRSTMGAGLRSILSVLKARKTLFTNPIARIPTGSYERRIPLPLDPGVVRGALTSENPARAALAALAAFHALSAGDLRNARLADLIDGRLTIGDRCIPLAEPVRIRLTTWLDHRTRTWPHSLNPHLFITPYTAGRLGPVSQPWLGRTLGMPARVLREDRILHEIHATGGDVRHLCDLFGLTVGGALRYMPDLQAPTHVTT